MKKIIFFAGLFAFALTACKKDAPTEPQRFCHRASQTVNYVSGSTNNQYQIDFSFNADGQLISEGTNTTYTWSAQQIIKRVSDNGILQTKTTYTLDNAGRAVSETTEDGFGNILYTQNFQYDANGYLTTSSFSGSVQHTTTYEWSNGNLFRQINTSPFGNVITYTYTYDPQLLTPDSYTILPIFGKVSRNLRIREEGVYSLGSWTTSDIQYELDQYGNIIKEIVNFVDTGSASSSTYQYSYEGCE